jgi:hypothetical protein
MEFMASILATMPLSVPRTSSTYKRLQKFRQSLFGSNNTACFALILVACFKNDESVSLEVNFYCLLAYIMGLLVIPWFNYYIAERDTDVSSEKYFIDILLRHPCANIIVLYCAFLFAFKPPVLTIWPKDLARACQPMDPEISYIEGKITKTSFLPLNLPFQAILSAFFFGICCCYNHYSSGQTF